MPGGLNALFAALRETPVARAWWMGLPERASHVVHPPMTHDEWITIPENAKKLGMTYEQLMNAPQGVATGRVFQPHALDIQTLGGGLTKEELRALTEIVGGLDMPASVSKVRLGTPETTYSPVELQEFLAARSPRDLRKGYAGGGAVGPLKKAFDYGRGWWLNRDKGIIKEIANADLGPHGDHDGWIGIAKNARALGVDPKEAKAMQRGTYGYYLPRKMTEEWIAEGGKPALEQGRAMYMPMMGDEYAPANALFEKLYGMTPRDAAEGGVLGAGSSLDSLVRARLWPDRGYPQNFPNSLVMNNPTGVSPKDLQKLWDVIGNDVKVTPKTRFQAEGSSGELLDIPLMDALTRKRFSDGGTVADRYARQKQKAAEARQLSDTPRGPLADPQFLEDVTKAVVGETPGEIGLNVALGLPGKSLKLAGLGASAMMGAGDAEAGLGGIPQRVWQWLYRGRGGAGGAGEISAVGNKRAADALAARQAQLFGNEPHVDMVRVNPTTGATSKSKISVLTEDGSVSTQSRRLGKDEVEEVHNLYADGGIVESITSRLANLFKRAEPQPQQEGIQADRGDQTMPHEVIPVDVQLERDRKRLELLKAERAAGEKNPRLPKEIANTERKLAAGDPWLRTPIGYCDGGSINNRIAALHMRAGGLVKKTDTFKSAPPSRLMNQYKVEV